MQIIEGDIRLFLNKEIIDSFENQLNDNNKNICDFPPALNDNIINGNDENNDEDFIIKKEEKKENEIKEESSK